MKRWALGLALKKRAGVIWKWPICRYLPLRPRSFPVTQPRQTIGGIFNEWECHTNTIKDTPMQQCNYVECEQTARAVYIWYMICHVCHVSLLLSGLWISHSQRNLLTHLILEKKSPCGSHSRCFRTLVSFRGYRRRFFGIILEVFKIFGMCSEMHDTLISGQGNKYFTWKKSAGI